MDNKIKLEDTCLTVEQATELQALGVDMSDSIMVYCDYYDQVHDYELLMNNNLSTSYAYEVVNTLTNTEMLEILPKFEKYRLDIIVVDGFCYVQYIDEYNHVVHLKDINNTGYMLSREDIAVSIGKYTIRDGLFEMIKFLRTNKII